MLPCWFIKYNNCGEWLFMNELLQAFSLPSALLLVDWWPLGADVVVEEPLLSDLTRLSSLFVA